MIFKNKEIVSRAAALDSLGSHSSSAFQNLDHPDADSEAKTWMLVASWEVIPGSGSKEWRNETEEEKANKRHMDEGSAGYRGDSVPPGALPETVEQASELSRLSVGRLGIDPGSFQGHQLPGCSCVQPVLLRKPQAETLRDVGV